MGVIIFLLKWITYVSTFLFATVCLGTPSILASLIDSRSSVHCASTSDYCSLSWISVATGLYYIAEIVEDYEKTTRKVIKYTIWVRLLEPPLWHTRPQPKDASDRFVSRVYLYLIFWSGFSNLCPTTSSWSALLRTSAISTCSALSPISAPQASLSS